MTGGLHAYAAFACELADAAGAHIVPLFRQNIGIIDKPDESPVTEADQGAERIMRAMIKDRFPDHGILGEEYGADRADAEWVWHLDPVDGTKSFITGSRQFVTLIALTRDGVPVVGVINQPVNGERWVGVEGQPTTYNGAPAKVRSCDSLASASMYTWGAECLLGPNGDKMQALAEAAKLARFSADGYAYGLLASGHIDLVADETMKPHDYLALAPVVTGAGGLITDWQGNPIRFGVGEFTLASGDRRVHDAALQLLG